MKSILEIPSNPLPTSVPVLYGGVVSEYDAAAQRWVIDDVFTASVAVSLLVQPCLGDKVCFVEIAGDYFITQILSRSSQVNELTIESDKKMHWLAPELKFTGVENIELLALNKIGLISKDCVVSVSNTLLQQAQTMLQHVGECSLTAKGLLNIRGKHQVISAEEDVRIDGKRINMG
ncbi:DUF3540 domain-containing protein [Marinomonas aquiplantarum]|uniref:Uncharacterized protein DUF3540 n=1 Tax=Marinomonas aquiplantarum TaxID=491951 RepID=A0A366CXB9_9GAMM|nr:DUF3540 domain-containing protein [Marinomonas aquiplantarum]RBO81914.1 uncharacterized protein DUF3540 [Marinomonas aquiplantarum]